MISDTLRLRLVDTNNSNSGRGHSEQNNNK